ncbi:MAG TPA: response regulator, partial [Polyangiaceae bacterium]|nr:response regulator [Polyangiaceae bacterium]
MTSGADFVLQLGRHVAELKGALDRLEASPADGALRDELRSRLGALAATARTLALAEVNDRLALAQRTLEGSGPPNPTALLRLRSLLDDLPTRAWADNSLKTPVGGSPRLDLPEPARTPGAPPPLLRGGGVPPLRVPAPSPAATSPRAPGPLPGAASPRAPGPPPGAASPRAPGPPPGVASPRAGLPPGAASPRPGPPPGAASPRPAAPPGAPSPWPPGPPPAARPGRPPAQHPPPPGGAEARPTDRAREPDTDATIPSQVTWPTTALVVGGLSLTNALAVGEGGPQRAPLEWERCEKPEGALDLARALAPDVVLLDGDLPGADEFAQKLGADALTEPVPLVVVGHFRTPDDAARWLALGAFQVLPRPASPDAIRNACLSAVAAPHRPTRPEPLGERTIDELAEALAEELRQGLVGSTSDTGRELRVALGDGHDVRAALWAAIARIRDVVTIRTGGAVRFSGGPEGALPLASWLTDSRAPGSRAEAPPPSSVGGAESELGGRRVLVVDDDPAVRWFLLGLFRAAGAEVFEATDGNAAFALACRALPDLVVSDVIMPGRDGFALCRSIKRDLVLRDAAVILLSWKEDLLQRMRELGASADAYLRKEANAPVVLARAREVLRPRARLEARLPGEGEVRGRLDGLTVRTLLAMVAKHRPDARVSVRDASFLYEVDVREGAPRRATRTASDGSFERGARVIAGLAGVGAGRFVVTSAQPGAPSARGDLRGSLDEQLFEPVCRARAAQRLLSESGLLNVKRVGVDLGAVGAYLEATPEPMRAHVLAIAEGTPPRALVLKGLVSAALLERLLDDVIAHGGLNEIVGTLDEDLLAPAIEYERAVLRSASPVPPPPGPSPALREQGVVPVDLYTPSPLNLLPSAPLPPVAEKPAPTSAPTTLQAGQVVDVGAVQPQTVVEVTEPLLAPPNAPAPPAAQPEPYAASPSFSPPGQNVAYAQVALPPGGYAPPPPNVAYPAQAAQAPPGGPAPGAPPAYGAPPGHGAPPAYGAHPGYEATPAYGAQPGYDAQPGHGGQPGYEAQPAYGGQPPPDAQTYGPPPPYGAPPNAGAYAAPGPGAQQGPPPGAPPPQPAASGSPRIPPPPPPRAPMATPSRLYVPGGDQAPRAPAPAASPRAPAPAAPVLRAPEPPQAPAVAPIIEDEPTRASSPGRTLVSWVLAGLVLAGVGGGFWWYSRGGFGSALGPAPTATTPAAATPPEPAAPGAASAPAPAEPAPPGGSAAPAAPPGAAAA